jgi:putative intracellular protease/amidase
MGQVLCFLYNNMADFEMSLICYLLAFEGKKEIITIGYEKEIVYSAGSKIGYKPSITVKEALELKNVEGLIIPGGLNSEQRPELTELIQKLNQSKKLLAAICRGPQYLARAGVLKDRFYTTTMTLEVIQRLGIEDPFPRQMFTNKRVIRDDNIITAIDTAFVEFSIEICDWFHVFKDIGDKMEMIKAFKN